MQARSGLLCEDDMTRNERIEQRLAEARGRAARPEPETLDPEIEDEANLEESAPAVSEPVADVRRHRLLEGIDPAVAALITDAELDEIEREERAAAEASRKKRALGTIRDQVRQKARIDND